MPAAVYQAYRATSNYVSPDGRTVQFSTGLKAGDPGSTPAMNAVPPSGPRPRRSARSIGAADSAVGGEAPALYDISSISNSDLKHVIPIAILAIGILLALVLRSLVAPLYLIASVGISYLAALGLSVLIFIKLGNSGGLVFFMPFLMFIFLLALGEDYNILVMTRIREEAQQAPAAGGGRPRAEPDRHHGHLGRAGAGRHVPGPDRRGRQRVGRQPDPRHRPRPGAGHADGHIPGPHAAGAFHRGAARPLELVAVADEPRRRAGSRRPSGAAAGRPAAPAGPTVRRAPEARRRGEPLRRWGRQPSRR